MSEVLQHLPEGCRASPSLFGQGMTMAGVDTPFIYPQTDLNLQGKTLVVPTVSTGNVPQLAVDLLIASFPLRRLAVFDPGYFIPVVGGKEDEEGITTPLELYGETDSSLFVIQQRSPVLKSKKQDFVNSLLHFIQSSAFVAVLFISSVDSFNRTDSQMFTRTYQIQLRNSPSLEGTLLEALTSSEFIPIYTSPAIDGSYRTQEAKEDSNIPLIPGGGLTRRILNSLPVGWSIPTASLVQFALEGDNRSDARLLAAITSQVLGYNLSDWRQPASWENGLFGTPSDYSLYG